MRTLRSNTVVEAAFVEEVSFLGRSRFWGGALYASAVAICRLLLIWGVAQRSRGCVVK